MVSFLAQVKATGEIPGEHYSHDHLNKQHPIPIDDAVLAHWRSVFTKQREEHNARGERVVYGLVDGFLLYWHKVSVNLGGTWLTG
jgi:nicotinamide/nicotinate riboside kinase